MPIIKERYFIFAQVPREYFYEFIGEIRKNPRIGTVLEYDDVDFIILGKEHYVPRLEKGAKPVGKEAGGEPSVLWIGSCDLSYAKEALKYVSKAHPWEVPMIFGSSFDFPVPTKKERRGKHKGK